MNSLLSKYVYQLTHVRRDSKKGGAPHKPILLLSIIHLFEIKKITNKEIYITPEIIATFKKFWSQLVTTDHDPIFALPFYHMKSEPFWQLIPNPGCEQWIEAKGSMRSITNLTTAVNVALIHEDLENLLLVPESRDILKLALLEKFFKQSLKNYKPEKDWLEASLLYEDSEVYQKNIAELKHKIKKESFQEEIYLRSSLFKREIPKIYYNTCAISGLRIDALAKISMVDACHIIPFAKAYDDTITNGIALCPNLHRAFDRGLITIDDNYRVLITRNLHEASSEYTISQFENKQINLPDNQKHYPSLQALAWHRKEIFLN
mgnify:CR=1 FL=1|tara:strand:+ start:39 stop:995 length:957 start_codon:yes stop_codon:yes gene_type:complete